MRTEFTKQFHIYGIMQLFFLTSKISTNQDFFQKKKTRTPLYRAYFIKKDCESSRNNYCSFSLLNYSNA